MYKRVEYQGFEEEILFWEGSSTEISRYSVTAKNIALSIYIIPL